MKLLILYYSHTGNNRMLAKYLANRLGADLEEVKPGKGRKDFSILLDMLFRRKPKIEPITAKMQDYDHVLFLAPLWNMYIAHPMKSAMQQVAKQIGPYSFISFCGYRRPGQSEHMKKELDSIFTHSPAHYAQLIVGDLVPEAKRKNVTVVSKYQVQESEMAEFETDLKEIDEWFVTA